MFEPLKRNLRPLTHFICKELLYDFQRGKIDKDRKVAVEKYLEENPDLKKDLDIYKIAITYTDNLAKTKVTDSYVLELKEVRPLRKKILQKIKWSNLPDITRWMIEGFVLSACVMLMGVILPWDKMARLWPDIKTKFETQSENKDLAPTNSITIVAPTTVAPTPVAVTKPEPPKIAPVEKPILKETNANLKVENPIVQEKVKRMATTGLLYSMNMKMKYDSSALNLIKSKLIEMGAVKAGQVGLGWRKLNPPGSYYHFSIPENKYGELTKLLEQFSTLRSYKNVHPRVMPEGQIRVILWIEDIADAKTKNEMLLKESTTDEETNTQNEDVEKNNVDVMDQEGQ